MTKKVVFLCSGPHYLHKQWAELVNAREFRQWGRHLPSFLRMISVFDTAFALLTTLFVPKADTYLVEGVISLLPLVFNKRKGSRIILINSDTFFYELPKQNKLYKWFIRTFVLGKIDGVISTSDYMKTLTKPFLKVPHEVVNPYVNSKYFRHSADLNSKSIGHVGFIRYSKGVDVLLDVFNSIPNEYKDKLYLIGPDWEKKTSRMIKKLDNKNIIVTGYTNNPEKYLEKCGLYMNLARHEPFGINILEAMAMGITPIVSNHCGASDIVMKLDRSLVVGHSKAEIVRKAVRLQNNINLKMKLGKKAKIIARYFTREKSMEDFRKAFMRLSERSD